MSTTMTNGYFLEAKGLTKYYPIRTELLARKTGRTVVLNAMD